VTGDGAAMFADLYMQLRQFASVVRSVEMDADDLVQEALVRTLTRHKLDDLDDPAAYLRTVIVRVASNDRRSMGRRRRALARTLPESVQITYPSDTDDLWRLAPDERAAVYLSIVERRSHREIASILCCSEDASRQRVSRALVRLRAEITAEADNG
jgi:DNA-directed RNA polymerase specialized sigma24 family protein